MTSDATQMLMLFGHPKGSTPVMQANPPGFGC
ncbi:hypothetical protein PCA31118_04172 [Pandoraea captiosa]|uniref:Uncharacterized protein n=1 Tax=Pandoraea captiosa TaxID=2508302 RepID=A0A5E5AIR2_9BURK|nr:hypothetical protein PCA31118_04172 [Pandoraea captiosa]